MSSNQEAQLDELLALASIYDEEEFHREESNLKGEIHLCLKLPPDFKLLVRGERCIEYEISFLSLVLSFQLPLDYPSSCAPDFTLSSRWLSRVQMSTLCKKLDEIWKENRGAVVLFTWIQFIKEETLEFLKIHSPLEIRSLSEKQSEEESVELDQRALQAVDAQTDLLTSLLDFDEAQKQKLFDTSVFCCGVCFCENLGSSSMLFKECQHVYCRACIKEYFEIQIRDGTVQHLTCPESECSTAPSPAQVKALVSPEVFSRYDRLLLQWRLNLMADVVYCPRMSCCTAVLMEPDKTMGICPSCQFVFCLLCKRTYHALALCKELEEEKARQEAFLAWTVAVQQEKDRQETLETQKREDEDWVKLNSKQCPSCGANIQKEMGCNKMTCTSCLEFFCWICLKQLCRGNPYKHFSDSSSPCFDRLNVELDENGLPGN